MKNSLPGFHFDPGLVLVVLLALFAIAPLLAPGLPNTADGPIHFYRAVDMQQAWQYGVYYPRWSANLALGYGTPLFDFAPPLLYILMMLLNQLGLDLALTMKIVVILFILVAGWGSYLLGRDLLGRNAALVVAAAYLLAPYRLRELYIQGNYAQFLGLALYPLILWAFFHVIESGRPVYVILGALSYAALLMSHNISAMIFTPLLAAYVLFWLVVRRRTSAVKPLLLTGALGLGFAAFFWIPAFYERRFIQLSLITQGHFDFRLHFLSLKELFAPYTALDFSAVNVLLPRSLGWSQLVLAVIGVIGIVFLRRLRGRARGVGLLSLVLLAACTVMMLPVSTPLWEHVPLLKLTEFPWRVLGPTTIPLALLAGAGALALAEVLPEGLRHVGTAACLVLLIVPSFCYLFPQQPFVDYSGARIKDITAYEQHTKAFGTTSAGEFLPLWTVKHPTGSPMIADYEAGRPIDKIDRSSMPAGVQAEEIGRGYTSNAYRFRSETPFTVRFNTLSFPGWHVYLDGRRIPDAASDPDGLIEANVPAGTHDVKLNFETTPVRLASDAISLLSVPALIAWLVKRKRVGEDAPRPSTGGWHGNYLAVVGISVIALLVLKEGVVGPFTGWFRVASPPGVAVGAQHPLNVHLGDQAALLGYDLDSNQAVAGQPMTVAVYWQALPGISANYRSFVHLDALPDLTTAAQSDAMHPGGIPMTTWPSTMYARDEHRLDVPATTPPGVYVLRTGLYDPETGRRLTATDDAGTAVGDAIQLSGILVKSAQPISVTSLPAEPKFHFGEGIQLSGHRITRSGSTLRVALYWTASQPILSDYKVFVHVLDGLGNVIAQVDGVPAGGRYPTAYWPKGEIIEDVREVPIPGELGDDARIAVGMYQPDTMARLEARDESGNVLPEGRVMLQVAANRQP